MIRIEYGSPDSAPCKLASAELFSDEPLLCHAMNELTTGRPASE